MKMLWLYVMSSALLIVASGWISMALSNAGEPLSGRRSVQSIATPPPPQPASTHNGKNSTAYFADYVLLHETRNDRTFLQIAERTNVCDGIALGATN